MDNQFPFGVLREAALQTLHCISNTPDMCPGYNAGGWQTDQWAEQVLLSMDLPFCV